MLTTIRTMVSWNSPWRRAVIASAILLPVMAVAPLVAQEEEKELYERPPFDRLTLTKGSGGAVIELVPVEMATRVAPNPKPKSGKLTIRRLEDPDKQYEVNWISIEKLELFEAMLLERAQKLSNAKQFDLAFRYFAFIKAKYPDTPGLDEGIQEYLYLNAGAIAADQPNRAFAILEELYRLNSNYKYPGGGTVTDAIDGIVGGVLETYLQAKDYSSMRRMLQSLGKLYGDARLASLQKYRNALEKIAAGIRDQALAEIESGDLRAAYLTSRRMLGVWPAVQGGEELAGRLAKMYPIVSIGVLDAASKFDPSAIENWSSRRAGRLMVRLLTEYRAAGPEGGEYQFPWGTYERSEDLRRLTLVVSRDAIMAGGKPMDGYTVARRLLHMANPSHPTYDPAWADLAERISVEAAYKVHVDLRRPSMIPESLLQTTLTAPPRADGPPAQNSGGYQIAEQKGDLVRFTRRADYAFRGSTQPAEIVERKFEGSQYAIQALLDQEIDAIDRIYPAFVSSLEGRGDIRVSTYETPTLHFLVPNLNKTYPASRTFRRALLYGIDRERILNSTLFEGAPSSGSRIISGPFPAARDADDPLAYAYDDSVEPIPYFPQHSVLLGNLAQIEFNQLAEKNETKPPKPETLILAHSAGEQATMAATAIAAQWNLLGFTTKLKALPPGVTVDRSDDWHFLYVEAMIREPVVDARRLLAFDGVARSDSDHMGQALRRLETARNWKELRRRLHEVHHTVHSELVVLPLFQVVDQFAYRVGLRGVGDHPTAFYQNVEFWEITPKPVD